MNIGILRDSAGALITAGIAEWIFENRNQQFGLKKNTAVLTHHGGGNAGFFCLTKTISFGLQFDLGLPPPNPSF